MINEINKQYVGISEDRLHHIIGVARKCYAISKERGYDENFCRRMFMLGYLHDVGYEFAETNESHAEVSVELLQLLGLVGDNREIQKVRHAIKLHSKYTSIKSSEWVILSTADLTVDSKGNEVDVMDRLKDIKDRYGENSDQYLTACDIAYQVKLISDNIARLIT